MKVIVPIALAACILAANAAPAITLPTRTTITEVNDAGLPISPGNVFSGSVTFDPADLPTDAFLPLDEPGRGLFLDFGDFSFDATDAIGFGTGFPALFVENGQIVGLDMSATVPPSSVFAGLAFEGGVFDNSVLFLDPISGATIVAGEFQVVPLPGALILLCSSLAALACTGRRTLN
jgi:hypothetical protein